MVLALLSRMQCTTCVYEPTTIFLFLIHTIVSGNMPFLWPAVVSALPLADTFCLFGALVSRLAVSDKHRRWRSEDRRFAVEHPAELHASSPGEAITPCGVGSAMSNKLCVADRPPSKKSYMKESR